MNQYKVFVNGKTFLETATSAELNDTFGISPLKAKIWQMSTGRRTLKSVWKRLARSKTIKTEHGNQIRSEIWKRSICRVG